MDSDPALSHKSFLQVSRSRTQPDNAPTAEHASRATPGNMSEGLLPLQGRRFCALQGAPIDSETQGVALGYHAAALSAATKVVQTRSGVLMIGLL